MQRTRTMAQTDTTQAARYVSNRIRGDLLSIHEKFGMNTVSELGRLAHDIEVGLRHDCLDSLSLFLYPPGWHTPHTAYIYSRAAPGSFELSPHSGRIARCSILVGGFLRYEVRLRCSATWEALKPQLLIPWAPCVRQTTHGMSATADGGYASGQIGMSRTHLRLEGY